MSARSLDLKRRMQAGEYLVGAWLSFSEVAVAEIVAGAGYDWILIDTEHAPFSPEGLQAVLAAFNGRQTVPMVRVPWNDPVKIKQVLDLGADGVLAPMVKTAAEAQAAVAACKYPPEGMRGFGPRRASDYYRNVSDYIASANESIVVAVQIEHIQAVENLESILSVPGIDLICLGPMDLSASMGFLGDMDHPRVSTALNRIVEQSSQKGLPVCLGVALDPDTMLEWASKGARFIIATEDHMILRQGLTDTLLRFREGAAKAQSR